MENIVGKGEIARFEQCFHNVFKSCLLLMGKNEYLWSKGLTLYQLTKKLDFPNSKEIANDKINIAENLSERIENIVVKGENAVYQHFLFFQNDFMPRVLCYLNGFTDEHFYAPTSKIRVIFFHSWPSFCLSPQTFKCDNLT